ncbi:MAG: SET domain-containing protein [Myxococcales bacterium]|nr:SET domain-containing protein [Myxococcales bacterium]
MARKKREALFPFDSLSSDGVSSPMPSLDGLKVVQSKIHGYGIVALRPFRTGDVLVFGDGVLYHEDQEFDDTYSLVYSDAEDAKEAPDRYFDLIDQTRWINHACGPNTEVSTDLDAKTGQPHAWWTALRDIEVGEELTYDYAFSGHLAEPCNCNNSACIGLIVDPAEISDVPAKLQPLIKSDRLDERRAQTELSELA